MFDNVRNQYRFVFSRLYSILIYVCVTYICVCLHICVCVCVNVCIPVQRDKLHYFNLVKSAENLEKVLKKNLS